MQDFGGNIWMQQMSWMTRVYLKNGLKEREREGMNEIPLAPDMDHWQIYVNMVINLD